MLAAATSSSKRRRRPTVGTGGGAPGRNAYIYADGGAPVYATTWGSGNKSNNRANLSPQHKRIIVDGTTSGPINTNYYHRPTLAAAITLATAGDWILMAGGATTAQTTAIGMSGIAGGVSTSDMMVFGTYDTAHNTDSVGDEAYYNLTRHRFDATGIGAGNNILASFNCAANYVAFMNWEFYAPNADQACYFNLLNTNTSGGNYFLFENCVWDGVTCTVQWQPNLALTSITSVGTTATATLSVANALMQTGDVFAIDGATPSAYNGTYTITRISNTQFSYTFAGGVGASTVHGTYNPAFTRIADAYVRRYTTFRHCGFMAASSGGSSGANGSTYFSGVRNLRMEGCVLFHGGWSRTQTRSTPVASGGPSQLKHGFYVDDFAQDIKVMDCVSGWDSKNDKLTGGEFWLQNYVTIRSPYAWIYAATTSNHFNTSWPAGSTFKSERHLQVSSDDANYINDADGGKAAQIYMTAATSYYRGGLILNADNPTAGQRAGVVTTANGSTITTTLLMDQCVLGNWNYQTTTANPDAYTTRTFTNNVWANATSGSNTAITDKDAGYQSRLTATMALNAHTTFRQYFPEYFSTVTVGGTTLETEFNLFEFMTYNPNPLAIVNDSAVESWSTLFQYHWRSKLDGTT